VEGVKTFGPEKGENMTVDQLGRFRLSIQTLTDEIQTKTADLRKSLIQTAETQTPVLQDGLDHAKEETDLKTKLDLYKRTLGLRAQLNQAMKRIALGTFGTCSSCEEDIDMRRLQAHPVASLCLRCQGRRERTHGTTFHLKPGFLFWNSVTYK